MNKTEPGLCVYVIDDDPAVRDSLALMLGLLGYATAVFDSAEACLAAWRAEWAGCMLVDLKLPGKSGLELQAELRFRGSQLPFIVISAHGDVSSARAAFRSNAVDFLEKPFDQAALRAAIESAMRMESQRVGGSRADLERDTMLARLTPRERDVLSLAGRGLHAKEIAATLQISPRTVEVHKARLMEKLDARNVSELVRFAIKAKLD